MRMPVAPVIMGVHIGRPWQTRRGRITLATSRAPQGTLPYIIHRKTTIADIELLYFECFNPGLPWRVFVMKWLNQDGGAMKRVLVLSASICAMAGSLALATPGAAATGAVARPAHQAAYTTFPDRLYSVKAISASNVWAVGLAPTSSLIVHWNGRAWSQSHPLGGLGYYIGVDASSAKDVWAVGGTSWWNPSQTLAAHWNGRSWTRVGTPNPPGGGYFTSVAVTSASNAWAVGLAGPGPGITALTQPLIEHWNGKHWSLQHFQPPAGGGEFASVAALSASNAWAVGYTGDERKFSGRQTLIEHWNGRTWTRVPTPNEGNSSLLYGVTAVSSDNAWAVGQAALAADGTSRTLALHWDGRHWTVVPSQTPGGDAGFAAVTASWTHNIWAVGSRNSQCSNGGVQCKTLIEHWNGHRWTLVASPNPPSYYLNTLLGISAVSRTDIWAVGSTDFESTLIIHWNGTSWS
jgi:hypothetical protein